MRIISGTHKGRNIIAPGNLPVRPTTDFAKEALFNILQHQLELSALDALDLFSGTGNITYELASRGCTKITAVDNNSRCCAFIKKTAENLGLDHIMVIKDDVFRFLKNNTHHYDLIFADPPYDLPETSSIPAMVMERALLNENGLLIVEHGKQLDLSSHKGFYEKRNYGNVHFSFFRK